MTATTPEWNADLLDQTLRAVAAWGIGDSPMPLDVVLPEHPSDQQMLAGHLQRARLLGPLLAANTLGDVSIEEDFHENLRVRQEAALMWCLMLEVRLLEVREWFDSAGGVDHLVIKGPATAHLDSLDPSIRTFADVDVIVAGHHVDKAVAIINDHDATTPWAERRRGFNRRFAKSVTLTFPDGIELDLHRTLADGVFGHRIPLETLWRAPDHFDLGGVGFAALTPLHRLLHSAYHLTLGSRNPAIMNLRDLAEYLHRPDLAPHEVVPTAVEWRGEAVLATAIDLLVDGLSPSVVPPLWTEWRAGYTLSPAEVDLIERHREEGSSLGRAKLDIVRELPTIRGRAAYLTALAWPSKAHLRSRGLRRSDALRAVARRLSR